MPSMRGLFPILLQATCSHFSPFGAQPNDDRKDCALVVQLDRHSSSQFGGPLALGHMIQAASPLAHSYCRPPPSAWISLTRTWMSLTTLRGRCFAICCHSTSWWLDHRHPRSRLLSGTRVESMGSKSPLRERAVCTRLKSSIRIANLLAERTAEARSIVRSWEGISCSAAVSLPGFPVLV